MTQFATIDGQRIIKGDINIPYYGLWVADVELAETASIPDDTTIAIGNLTLTGHVFRSASFSGSRSARVVGGRGGLRKQVPSQGYYKKLGIKKSTILRDVCSIVGEQINIKNDATLGQYWVRESGTAERTVRTILGEIWYVDTNGTIQAQDRTDTSSISSSFEVIAWSGGKGRVQVSTEDVASWQPARTFKNSTVTVEQKISETSIMIDNNGKLRLDILTIGM